MDHIKNLECAIAEFETESKKIGNYNVLLTKLNAIAEELGKEKSLLDAAASDIQVLKSSLESVNNEFCNSCQDLQSLQEQEESSRQEYAAKFAALVAAEKEKLDSFLAKETQAHKGLCATIHSTIVKDADKIILDASEPLKEICDQLTLTSKDLQDLLATRKKLGEEILNAIDTAMVSNTRKHLNIYSGITAEVAKNINESANHLENILSETYQQNILLDRKLTAVEDRLLRSLNANFADVKNVNNQLSELNTSLKELGNIKILVIIAIIIGIVSCVMRS